jgi:hypothetical protein
MWSTPPLLAADVFSDHGNPSIPLTTSSGVGLVEGRVLPSLPVTCSTSEKSEVEHSREPKDMHHQDKTLEKRSRECSGVALETPEQIDGQDGKVENIVSPRSVGAREHREILFRRYLDTPKGILKKI